MANFIVVKMKYKEKGKKRIGGVELADRMKKGLTTRFLQEARKLKKSR